MINFSREGNLFLFQTNLLFVFIILCDNIFYVNFFSCVMANNNKLGYTIHDTITKLEDLYIEKKFDEVVKIISNNDI